jgi:hypothetical protein
MKPAKETTASIDQKAFVESIAYLLRETFEGSPEGQGSAYLDHGTGVFSTIETLSAADVSRDIAGTSIVAQLEHAKFYLDRICEFMGGRTEKVNWEDSWLIEEVTDEEWSALKLTLRSSYENVLLCVAGTEAWDEGRVGMAIGMVAHTAYHLGAIRQLAKRDESENSDRS